MSTLKYKSLPAMFVAACENRDFPGVFLRENNSWREYTPKELLNTLKKLVSAFKYFGIKKGSSVGIIAPSSPEWLLTDIAVQICGGITVPLFPNISEENFLFQCKDASIRNILVEKTCSIEPELAKHLQEFRHIFCLHGNDTSVPNNNEITWESLLRIGSQYQIDDIDFAASINDIDSEDIFSIIYTSGSTGVPKGVELSHRNILSQYEPLEERINVPTGSPVLSVLPMAHVFERAVVYYYIYIKAKIYFGDDPKQLSTFLKEVHPVILTVVPRLLERVYEKILKLSRTASHAQRPLLKRAIRYAQIADPLAKRSFIGRIYEALVFKKIRESLGSSFKYIISGSSALNKNICRFFLNLGIPVCEGYGMTETAPVISLNTDELGRPGSVGKPLEIMELKLSDDGEILVRGENVFKGYHNLQEKTSEFFTDDGFFKTGDSGYFGSNGGLYLTGRIKEMLKTSTGKYVSPVPIEEELCHNSLISSACVIANNRKFVSVILFLQPENARQLLEIDGEQFSMEKAVASNRINESIAKCIEKANQHLNYWEQIRKWVIVPDIPDTNNGMLTPTLKLRRRVVEKIYCEQIDKLYEE